jgi:glycerophosphoryl diester phosphodiesterase
MQMMKDNYTSKVGRKSQPGLYIEIKEPDWYRASYNIDTTQAIFDVLAKYNLETVEKATLAGIPIIIQSFNEAALRQFATLSDLPLIQLMDWGSAFNYDFDNIATYAHGVGPAGQWIMYYPSMTKVPVDSSPSLFINEMHERHLAVHPFTLRDDSLTYTSTPAQETALYYTKGVDGIFTEFVQTTYSLFELLMNPEQVIQ